MQNVSSQYQRIARNDPRYRYKVVIDGVGEFEETVKSASSSIQLFGEDPQIGKAISAEATVVMLNPATTIPKMACFRLYAKAYGNASSSSAVEIDGENLSSQYATGSGENITFSVGEVRGEDLFFEADGTEYLESEWIPQGVYFVDTRAVTANDNGLDIITINGFDAMLKTEQDYTSNDAVGDDYDTAFVQAIASAIGVEVDERTWEVMGGGHILTFPVGYSMREILGYIASIYIGCFIITDDGKLRLVSLLDMPTETSLLIDEGGEVIIFGEDAINI